MIKDECKTNYPQPARLNIYSPDVLELAATLMAENPRRFMQEGQYRALAYSILSGEEANETSVDVGTLATPGRWVLEEYEEDTDRYLISENGSVRTLIADFYPDSPRSLALPGREEYQANAKLVVDMREFVHKIADLVPGENAEDALRSLIAQAQTITGRKVKAG